MLDLMRKHATSFVIKLILGAIILSFAFFFGYNKINKQSHNSYGVPHGKPIAIVDGKKISDQEFTFFYDNNIERLKQTFTDQNMSESIRNFAKSMTLQQVIQRELLLDYALKSGIKVPDLELSERIQENIKAINKGEFDPVFYKHQYLPYYKNKYAVNYEDVLRRDIALDLFRSIFTTSDILPSSDEKVINWTFEIAKIDSKKLIDDKTITEEKEAKEIAKEFINNPDKNWEKIGKNKNIEVKKVGPITISDRNQILDGAATFEDYKKIFLLSEKSVINEPIEHGNNLFAVKLIKKEIAENSVNQPIQVNFLDSWLQNKISKAEIVNYMESNSR